MAMHHASYADWQRAYGDVYETLPHPPATACPNCAHTKTLRWEFVAMATDRIGYALFWCDFCQFGIRICRTEVPDGMRFYPMGISWAKLHKMASEYTLVDPPLDAGDPDDFEEVSF